VGIHINRIAAIGVGKPAPAPIIPRTIGTDIKRPARIKVDRPGATATATRLIDNASPYIVEKALLKRKGERAIIIVGVPHVLLVSVACESQHTIGDGAVVVEGSTVTMKE
jgi:hypothetical protein